MWAVCVCNYWVEQLRFSRAITHTFGQFTKISSPSLCPEFSENTEKYRSLVVISSDLALNCNYQ